MFSKGRKLVNLVIQNDQKCKLSRDVVSRPMEKPDKDAVSEKPPNLRDSDAIQIYKSSKTNESTVLVDDSLNSTTSEHSKILKHVLIPESPVINDISLEMDSETAQEDPVTNTTDIRTTNHDLIPHFDNNRSTPVHNSTKYFTDLDSGTIIEDSIDNLSPDLNSEDPTLRAASNTVTDLYLGTIPLESGTNCFDDSSSDFLDLNCFRESPVPTNPVFTNPEFQSLPSTSRQDAAEILPKDLRMSDDSDDEVSPYVDSESSYCPTPSPSPSSPGDRSNAKANDNPTRPTPSPSPSSPGEGDNDKENDNGNIPRRRKRGQPEKWRRNAAKKLRQSGKRYVNSKGKTVESRKCVPTDCSKCRYKCNEHFPQHIRQDIFNEYWNLGDDKRQKMLISSLVKHSNVLRISTKAKKNRNVSRLYFLTHKSVGQHRVCQKFFCNTFNISTTVINTCSKKVGYSDFYVGQDSRIGRIPYNKTPTEAENLVKAHIDMFPRMESHYCRKKTRKQYLESDLNLSKLYKTYKDDYCVKKQITPVSMFVYQRVFHSYEPPLAFYKPKKDQCTKCNVYRRAENKSPLQAEYDAHKRREQDSLDMKAEDKEKCINGNGSFRAILSLPFTGDSKIYYLRKLSMYNFTILDSYQNTGYCYLWDETNGKKGSIEIGTMLLKYLYSLPENVNQVASFSDSCGGQNRNKYVTLTALYAVNNIPHLNTVDLKFMESGHSYLEADSMHASIERARKHKSIFTLREYALIIQSARSKPKPYDILITKYDDFYDLKTFEKKLKCNTTKNTEKEIVQWLKIKWLRLSKESPTSIFYKYELRDSEFKEINLCKTRSVKKQQDCMKTLRNPLTKAYRSKMPISQAKKKDLITLLKDGVIPSEYANYYNNIPCAAEIIHVFTDSEESDNDE